MDDEVGVAVGPAERAHHAGAVGPTPKQRRRMSAGRKLRAVLRLLRGEDLELVSRELGVTAATLSSWRDDFLAGGEAALASRPKDGRDVQSQQLKAKLGEVLLERELLQRRIELLESGRPLARRRSRP